MNLLLSYDYDSYSSALGGSAAALSGSMSCISIIVSIFLVVCLWKIFVKAGEPGWASLIPFYNTYVMAKMAFDNGLWFLLTFVPFVNFVFGYVMLYKINKKFGKGIGFYLGLIFIPVVFLPILAFGDAQYEY